MRGGGGGCSVKIQKLKIGYNYFEYDPKLYTSLSWPQNVDCLYSVYTGTNQQRGIFNIVLNVVGRLPTRVKGDPQCFKGAKFPVVENYQNFFFESVFSKYCCVIFL